MTGEAGQRDRWVLLAILALALALRIAAALALPDQHFGDAVDYRNAGASLWATGRLGNPLFMPLYPALVGLTGPGWRQMAMDIVLSVIAVALIHRLVLAMFADRAAAALAALIAAVYPYFIFYAVVGLTETLFVTVLLAAVLCWYRGRFAAAALFAVLSVLTKPSFDPLLPLLVLYFALAVHRMPLQGALRQLALYAAIYVALMAPWWFHNVETYGSFVRLNAGSGIMLYNGNNPLNKTGGALDTDADRNQFMTIADPLARDRAMLAAGMTYIRDNPGRFIELAVLKFARFWRPWPHAAEYSGSFYMVVSLLSFVPLLGLALLYGAMFGRRDLRTIAPVLLLIVYLTSVHMVLASSLRYRLPLEPFLICFAAVALARLGRGVGAGRAALAWLGDRPAPNG